MNTKTDPNAAYNDHEEWRPIRGYETSYEVSTLGRVRSLDKVTKVVNNGTLCDKRFKGRILSLKCKKYANIMLSHEGEVRRSAVHIIVAEAFIPNPENKKQINHKNGVKWDNRVCNLEWVTCLENIRHARATGLYSADSLERMRAKQVGRKHTDATRIKMSENSGMKKHTGRLHHASIEFQVMINGILYSPGSISEFGRIICTHRGTAQRLFKNKQKKYKNYEFEFI